MMISETLEIIRTDSPAWMAKAECAAGSHDPDDWFPHAGRDRNTERTARAVGVCRHCPVRTECLDWAFETDEPWAVCGGMTAQARKITRTLLQNRLMDELGCSDQGNGAVRLRSIL